MSAEPVVPEGVPAWAWKAIGAEAHGSDWHIPEREGGGEIIGWSIRRPDGSKSFRKGGKRGLTLKWPLDQYAGTSADEPVFIVEGATDAAAGVALLLNVVGRPSATGGGELLAALLKDRHVCIIAENDGGTGRRGAEGIAAKLVGPCASVRIIAPPDEIKDLRAWLIANATADDIMERARSACPIDDDVVPTNGLPVLLRLSDVQPESVQWLWPSRFALGKLTLIAGDPGLGKSILTLDMAARVSRGLPWPDARDKPQSSGGVVLLSAEDGVADTIRPRLDAAGADVSRIVALDAIRMMNGHSHSSSRPFDLTRDISALEKAIESVDGCRLVVIDPVTAYLGGTDSHKNADTRALLAPLADLAAHHRVAVVAVTHLNKNAGGPAIYRAMGSLAFIAAARQAWVVSKDKDDPDRRLLLPIKNNLAPDTEGLAYRIEAAGSDDRPVVVWEDDPVSVSADDVLADHRGDGRSSSLEEAKDWLREQLADGSIPAADVKAAADRDGIKSRTLDRAKSALDVMASREGFGTEGRWVWTLPHGAPPPDHSGLAHNGDVGAQCDSEVVSGDSRETHRAPDSKERQLQETGDYGAHCDHNGEWGEV
jgi:hypothetical protein